MCHLHTIENLFNRNSPSLFEIFLLRQILAGTLSCSCIRGIVEYFTSLSCSFGDLPKYVKVLIHGKDSNVMSYVGGV